MTSPSSSTPSSATLAARSSMASCPEDVANKVADFIERLKAAGQPNAKGLVMVLTKGEVEWLIDQVSSLFLKESTLLEADPPLTICGDTHGQFSDVLRIFDAYGWPEKEKNRYLFLGDYVDRGVQSIEVICIMFALKVQYPMDIFLLRGNHEFASTNAKYGFKEECLARLDVDAYVNFNRAFESMPLAGLVGKRILCMHGGLSPELVSTKSVASSVRFCRKKDGLIRDLMWSDPDANVNGFAHNVNRGISWAFGADAVLETCNKLDIDLIVRGASGRARRYEFFACGYFVTVFSAPNFIEQGNVTGIDPMWWLLICIFYVYCETTKKSDSILEKLQEIDEKVDDVLKRVDKRSRPASAPALVRLDKKSSLIETGQGTEKETEKPAADEPNTGKAAEDKKNLNKAAL